MEASSRGKRIMAVAMAAALLAGGALWIFAPRNSGGVASGDGNGALVSIAFLLFIALTRTTRLDARARAVMATGLGLLLVSGAALFYLAPTK